MYSEHEQAYEMELSAKKKKKLHPTSFSQENSIPDVNPGSKCTSNLAINSKIKNKK